MQESDTLKKDQADKWRAIARQDLEYHRRQFEKPYRSTSNLAEFMKSLLGRATGDALDVGCGAGANIFHLGREFPSLNWTGVDIAGEEIFSLARPFFANEKRAVDLRVGDFYALNSLFGARKFDVVLSIQTLLVLPSYERLLDQLMSVTKNWLIISSLFTDFQVDVNVQVTDYTWPEECRSPGHYNVYSLSRFKQECEARGCKEFVTRSFEIDIDLPIPATRGLGTYTRRLEDGTRLQFTGPIFQPWAFVGVRM